MDLNNAHLMVIAQWRSQPAFLGGRLAHPEGQNEEENKYSFRKNKKNWSKFEERMRKVEPLLNRDCEAGYGPVIAQWITR